MPVVRTDSVEPEDICTGRMLVIMAEHTSSVTAWPDIPYEICKIVHVPAEFLDSPEEVQFKVEYYAADTYGDVSGLHTALSSSDLSFRIQPLLPLGLVFRTLF